MKFHLPILLAVGGNVLYHLSQKSIPKTMNPSVALLLAYTASLLAACVFVAVTTPNAGLLDAAKAANWAVVGVGVSAAMIEIGFLLAYRTGWNIGSTSILVNISVALILIPLGLALYKERLSATNLAGIALCIIGLFLISRK